MSGKKLQKKSPANKPKVVVDNSAILGAKDHILQAVSLLQGLGPDYHKICWLLEDSLVYLDQVPYEAEGGIITGPIPELPDEIKLEDDDSATGSP